MDNCFCYCDSSPSNPSRNQTEGTIIDVNRNSRSFTVARGRNASSVIRFNLADDARIFDRAGRPVGFSRLMPGQRVSVRHANFMTASIPPQTTAFTVRIL